MALQRAENGGAGKARLRPAVQALRQRQAGHQARGGGLHVALHARQLSGKADQRVALQREVLAQHVRAVQIGVAVHHAVAGELRVFQAGDHAEHALLLAPLEPGLEAHQIVVGGGLVLLAQLHHGVGLSARARVDQPHGLQRAVGQRLAAPGGQDLHGETALEHQLLLEVVQRGQLGLCQCVVEGVVFVLGHGAVQVVAALVIAALAEDLRHVQRIRRHDGRGGVEEVQRGRAGQLFQRAAERLVCQRAGGHDAGRVGDFGHQRALDGDVRVVFDLLRHQRGEHVPVHGQRAARGHARRLGTAQNQAAQRLHLRLQQAGGVGQMLGLQRVGAHQLGKALHVVGGGELLRLHLQQAHAQPALGQLPGGLTARQARADYGHKIIHRSPPPDCRDSPR